MAEAVLEYEYNTAQNTTLEITHEDLEIITVSDVEIIKRQNKKRRLPLLKVMVIISFILIILLCLIYVNIQLETRQMKDNNSLSNSVPKIDQSQDKSNKYEYQAQDDKKQSKQRTNYTVYQISEKFPPDEEKNSQQQVKIVNMQTILRSKDEQTAQYYKQFQSTSYLANWEQADQVQFKKWVESLYLLKRKRMEETRSAYEKIKKKFTDHLGYVREQTLIKYPQFINAIQYRQIVGQDYLNDQYFLRILKKEKNYYQKKYNFSEYVKEIPACIIVPSYNNQDKHRYLWNLESIFMQEYQNYKVIIIDDASSDRTPELINFYLKWKQVDKSKVVFIRNKKNRQAMENIYYSIHKYCNMGEIVYLVDGDDELVGTQTLKLFNSQYKKLGSYSLYSNFIDDAKGRLNLGISMPYPQEVKENNTYRYYKHCYSHLRTIKADLFLLMRSESLKDQKGKIYWSLYDNAMYFSAFQLSCGKVDYIPEINYWYNSATGLNDLTSKNRNDRAALMQHIFKQKRYTCIDDQLNQIGNQTYFTNKSH